MMSTGPDINEQMNRFRLASRELFNHSFRLSHPYESGGWEWEARFSEVEKMLFQKLVREPCNLSVGEYGSGDAGIAVALRGVDSAPAMVNREVNSGYWDHSVNRVDTDARMRFLRFFDWNPLDVRDNRYVRVQIEAWPTHQGLLKKHALIETQYIAFVRW